MKGISQKADRMDSLENKLDRLTPGQRREVDDFVDFLLQQSSGTTLVKMPVPPPSPPSGIAPPPFTVQEPSPWREPPASQQADPIMAEETPVATPPGDDSPVVQEITVGGDVLTQDYMDYGAYELSQRPASPAEEAVRKVKEKLIQKSGQAPSHDLLDWID
jgi:hypothetical protein